MSTWIKLHDNFWENPKVLAAGEDAATLYIQGLSYCSRNLTDGAIATAALRTLTARKDARTLARVLVREGLWKETASGWDVHDYLKVQRSREQVEAEREKGRQRQDKFRRSRAGNAVTTPTSNGVSNEDVTSRETEAETETEPPPPSPAPLRSPPVTANERAETLRAAAELIGERASLGPNVRNPAAMRRSVARGVMADRYQEAYELLAADSGLTPAELADRLDPGPKPGPRLPLVSEVLSAEPADWTAGAAGVAAIRADLGLVKAQADEGDGEP